MKAALGAIALLAPASCQRAENADRARLDDLTARVTRLEQRQSELQQALAAKEKAVEPSSAEAVTLWEFPGELGGTHRYGTKQRCEAALQAFEADRAAADAAKGVTVMRGTVPACNPV